MKTVITEIEKADNTEENIAELEGRVDGNTALGICILWVLDDAHENTNAYRHAKQAIEELADLRRRVEIAEAREYEE